MSQLTLVIGNKNYSSWSLRGWLFLKHTGAPFREIRIGLDEPDTRARIAQHSPPGRVPVLIDGDLTVWDSLAICEYLNENRSRRPRAGRPTPAPARLRARVSAEMHSGLQALRNEMPMNCRARRKVVAARAAASADIARVLVDLGVLPVAARDGGPWLFGRFSIADAMYAPVVFRFQTYGVSTGGATRSAMRRRCSRIPPCVEWAAAGRAETEVVPSDEAGTPA